MRKTLNRPRFYVPRSYAVHIVRVLCEQGYDADRLNEVRLEIEQQAPVGDDAIDFEYFKRFVREIQAITDNPCLGLRLGTDVPITANRLLGYAITSSANLDEAFAVATKYLATIYNFLDYELLRSGGQAVIRVHPVADLGDTSGFMFDMALSFLAALVRTFSTGQVAQRICFTRPRPPDTALYRECFECELEFGAPHNEIQFDEGILHLPSGRSDEVSFQLAVEQCDWELELLRVSQPVSIEIVALLKKFIDSNPGLEETARSLRLSPRTLRRRLQEEGTNFQSLQRQVKFDLACDYLAGTAWPVSQIASRLGYEDVSAFSKAFRTWTGQTPREYRDRYSGAR